MGETLIQVDGQDALRLTTDQIRALIVGTVTVLISIARKSLYMLRGVRRERASERAHARDR